jgi:hypothetical protein
MPALARDERMDFRQQLLLRGGQSEIHERSRCLTIETGLGFDVPEAAAPGQLFKSMIVYVQEIT